MNRALLLLLLLGACASEQQVFVPQPVDMPIAVACKAPTLTPPPDLMAALPTGANLTQSLSSCLRQTLNDKGYIEQLTAALKACSE